MGPPTKIKCTKFFGNELLCIRYVLARARFACSCPLTIFCVRANYYPYRYYLSRSRWHCYATLDQKALLNPEAIPPDCHSVPVTCVGWLSLTLKYLSHSSHPDSFIYMIATNVHLSCIFHHYMIYYLTGGSAAAWHDYMYQVRSVLILIFVGGASHEN